MATPSKKQAQNPTKEKINRWLDSRQHRTADYLNGKTKSWSRKGKTLFLIVICFLFAASSVTILFSPKQALSVHHLHTPVMLHFPKPPKKPPGIVPMITDSTKQSFLKH